MPYQVLGKGIYGIDLKLEYKDEKAFLKDKPRLEHMFYRLSPMESSKE